MPASVNQKAFEVAKKEGWTLLSPLFWRDRTRMANARALAVLF